MSLSSKSYATVMIYCLVLLLLQVFNFPRVVKLFIKI